MSAQDDIDQIEADALAAVAATTDLTSVEEVRLRHTGRKSRLSAVLATIGSLPPDRRGPVGKRANEARRAVEAALGERQRAFEADEQGTRLAAERADVTLPGDPYPAGSLHIITQLQREVEEIFLGMGWKVADGPEIEDAFHNFTALNIPEGHPARASSDTFYVEGHEEIALRPQTSPVQIRTMETEQPPIYVVCPGAVYRRDDVDPTHSPMFHQLEGLAVDEGLSMAHLKGMLGHFVRELLGPGFEIRLRPDYFPFTEPSVEVDVLWTDRHGRSQWLELLGAGMVDPNVFHFVGIDPERWSGFAWGMGLDRLAMLRHGVSDLRLLFENDLRFLGQFR